MKILFIVLLADKTVRNRAYIIKKLHYVELFGASIFIFRSLLKIPNYILVQDLKLVFIVVDLLLGKIKKIKMFREFFQNCGMAGLVMLKQQIGGF